MSLTDGQLQEIAQKVYKTIIPEDNEEDIGEAVVDVSLRVVLEFMKEYQKEINQ